MTQEGEFLTLTGEELDLSYRHSCIFEKNYVVLSARFSFEKGESDKIKARMDELAKARREKQPLEFPSAGSTFKRPEGYFAGKLIQDAGLKGYTVGGAQVSEKHSGFVVNRGGATAEELSLIHIFQTIGILTSGGDAPGMNAALRAVARTAWARGIDVKGIYRGYSGLLNDEIFDMEKEFTCDIISRGGTALFTARCEEFKQLEYQEKAAEILRSHNIDGLVVIGGDGSFRGAQKLSAQGINTVALPGTIDLDIACTEYTIGFDTAVNTAMQAIDKIRDSSTSHERCSIIEVMGRNAGYIALWCGIASGAEDILIPERFDGNRPKLENELIESILEKKALGKKHHLIINAEGCLLYTSVSTAV